MTTTPDNANEPADLSELTATDALLDRLGARKPSEADLGDPTAAVLADLVAMIDQAREPDTDAARLIEVLAGRPLYIAGGEPAADQAALLIDLTEHDLSPDEDQQDKKTDDQDGDATGESPITRLPKPAVVPIRIPSPEPVGAGRRRWERVLSQAALPAASVLVLLAVGGGVSAAVTGDPMTPVNGITRVMAQLPGVSNGSLDKIKREISAAKDAARTSNTPLAYAHLNNARAILDDVPDTDKTTLNQQIEDVAVSLPSTAPATAPGVPGVGVPAGSGSVPAVVATSSAAVDPQQSASPTPTVPVTNIPATVEPSDDSGPTSSPTPADPAPSSQAAASDPTPAAATSSP
jgi:hypothetical protein